MLSLAQSYYLVISFGIYSLVNSHTVCHTVLAVHINHIELQGSIGASVTPNKTWHWNELMWMYIPTLSCESQMRSRSVYLQRGQSLNSDKNTFQDLKTTTVKDLPVSFTRIIRQRFYYRGVSNTQPCP